MSMDSLTSVVQRAILLVLEMRLQNEKFGDIDSIGVRMPSALKAKIKAAAKANRHSMNAEIVERLERSFPCSGENSAKKEILLESLDGLSDIHLMSLVGLINALKK